FLSCFGALGWLCSFPTRRSSDLRAMLDFGMPMGPLRLLDEVGLDVAVHVAKTLSAAFPDRMRIPEVAAKLAEKGHLGRKSGSGLDRKSTRLNSSHVKISYAVFCL